MYANTDFDELLKHRSQLHGIDFSKTTASEDQVQNRILDTPYIQLDYNRNLIDAQTLPLLEKFLLSKDFFQFRDALYRGGIVNATENRSADHIALRDRHNLFQGSVEVKNEIQKSLVKMRELTGIIHSGQSTPFLAGGIKHIVHIGIGGSDLGPRMVVDALREFRSPAAPEIFFISSVDPYEIQHVLSKVDLQTTLFLTVSKSFNTPEIRVITENILEKFKGEGIGHQNHFIIISANEKAPGILNTHPENFLKIPESVGGRFSLWSATGLVICLHLGFDRFSDFLTGASETDRDFLQQPPLKNLPVILGLLEFWYTNFFQSRFFTVNPYTERLRLLPMFLQQLQMESNGKSTNLDGQHIDYPTSAALIGVSGTACQHSYFQALHQGTHFFHADLIGLLRAPDFKTNPKNHSFLFSSMLAQAQTMISGYDDSPGEKVEEHKKISGNKPCNLILLKEWKPAVLGNLLAMYEHKTAVLGILWQVNSFDQWGVERGKKICTQIEEYIDDEKADSSFINPVNKNNIRLFKNL